MIGIKFITIVNGEELFRKLLFVDLERKAEVVQIIIMIAELCVDVA